MGKLKILAERTLTYPDAVPGEPDHCVQNPSHRQVALNYGDTLVAVDEGMSQLLPRLWDRQIDTVYSCQGHPAKKIPAYILFANSIDAERFCRSLKIGYPVFKFATSMAEARVKLPGKKRAQWVSHPENWEWLTSAILFETAAGEPARLEFRTGVYFPGHHIPAIMDALR